MVEKDKLLNEFVEIEPLSRDEFLKVRETLTRIGVPSRQGKTLYQSAHVLQSRGRYFIVHFKEMFMLDGKHSDFSDEDRERRDYIAGLLSQWGMVKIMRPLQERELGNMAMVVPHKYKSEWKLVAKYQLGTKTKEAE